MQKVTRSGRRLATGSVVLVCLAALACSPGPTLTPGTDAVPPPGGGGVVGTEPDIETTPGATTTPVSYGPFTVPAATGTGHEQEGMLTQLLPAVRKPCTNCYLTGMRTILQYPDGRDANVDTGQWLHHAIFSSLPRPDATCANSILGWLGERFFATGNERSRARFPAGYGYQVGAGDTWQLMFDLMNSNTTPSTVKIVTIFEWVPATTANMTPLRPVWIDATNQCLNSGLPPSTGQYSYTTEWVVNRPGKVIGVGAHMHDGGTHVSVTNATTGELICNHVAGYGGPGYEEPESAGHGHDGGDDHGDTPPTTDGHTGDDHARMHLSSMTKCLAPSGDQPVATIAAGQRVRFVAYYDTTKRAQKGSHPVMGVGLVYVAAR